MKGRNRISRRVMRRFLQLAAATFAVSAGGVLASYDDMRPASENHGEGTNVDESGEDARHSAYQHTFSLADPRTAIPHRGARAQLRVLDATGRKLTQLALHGASMVGPFEHGAYTVLLRTDGLTEIHRIRIGPDTLPYLHFVDLA